MHVVIAVAAGSLLALLPRRPVETVVAGLLPASALLLWTRILLAEWGDLTQILCAKLAARYRTPLSVGVGAVLGLWTVGLLAILGGKGLLRLIPVTMIVRVAAVVMFWLAGFSLSSAARG